MYTLLVQALPSYSHPCRVRFASTPDPHLIVCPTSVWFPIVGLLQRSSDLFPSTLRLIDFSSDFAFAPWHTNNGQVVNSYLPDSIFDPWTFKHVVRTRSDTIPINPDPEPYLLISQPHLNLAIPFPVSPLRIRSSRLTSLHFGLCSTFPLSSASDPLS